MPRIRSKTSEAQLVSASKDDEAAVLERAIERRNIDTVAIESLQAISHSVGVVAKAKTGRKRPTEQASNSRRLRMPLAGTREAIIYNTNQSQSRLLRLPAEIHNQIYMYALSNTETTVASKWRRDEPDGKYNRKFDVNTRHIGTTKTTNGIFSLFPVCRQLHQETALMEYRLGAWCFVGHPLMYRYLMTQKRLKAYKANLIPELIMEGTHSPREMTVTMWKLFRGVEAVRYRHRLVNKAIAVDKTDSPQAKVERVQDATVARSWRGRTVPVV